MKQDHRNPWWRLRVWWYSWQLVIQRRIVIRDAGVFAILIWWSFVYLFTGRDTDCLQLVDDEVTR